MTLPIPSLRPLNPALRSGQPIIELRDDFEYLLESTRWEIWLAHKAAYKKRLARKPRGK